MERCDVLVLGAGPGGLAAAAAAQKQGAEKVILLDRDKKAGGILNQCIHDGFGLIRYGSSLSGPEYAGRALREAREAGVSLRLGLQAVSMTPERRLLAQGEEGLVEFEAGAIVLATGCRERTRGAIAIPGTRPAGIFTAGVLLNFVNVRNMICGKRVVILGSGDIGLIMARRLTLEGARVEAVLELMPQPGGLARNVSQCLYDYGIPLYCSHTVSNILGKKKIEAVEAAPVDEDMNPIPGKSWIIPCDALVLSVGLIPENEVALTAGLIRDEKSGGAKTNDFLMTNLPGVFACGNCRKVMDLADFVSRQSTLAGENAVRFLKGKDLKAWNEQESGHISGNRCPRGEAFIRQEQAHPARVLTTTLRVEGGEAPLVSVRSHKSFGLDHQKEAVRQLKHISVKAPVQAGDVLARLLFDGEEIQMLAGEEILAPAGPSVL